MLAHFLATSACGGLFPCFWACGEMKGVIERNCQSGQEAEKQYKVTVSIAVRGKL